MHSKVSMIATAWFVLAAASNGPAVTGGVMNPPTDPEIAVEGEYRNFKAEGTREALELFIARHPDHPLAKKAREDIRRLYK
ncbi:hypothetical protein [Shinella sp.]|uniref:hypothetical protein n=1 Tax=Shinella sp. TaxID=1870904 RepID=UPI0028B15D65|nr:hypothetical protein [Shinella sp.]